MVVQNAHVSFPVPLDVLLNKCKVPFRAVKASSRRRDVLKELARKSGVACNDEQVDQWEQEWVAWLESESSGSPQTTAPAPPAPPPPSAPISPPPQHPISIYPFFPTPSTIDPVAPAQQSIPFSSPPTPPPPILPLPPHPAPTAPPAPSPPVPAPPPPQPTNKLFVGGLPSEVDEALLRFVFGQFGQVLEAEVKRDPRNGRSRGFGFVTFSEEKAAHQAARQRLVTIRQKKVEVQLAVPTGDPSLQAPRGPDPSCKVFVGGLPQECTEGDLEAYFRRCGTVVHAEVKRDHSNGRSRGFGFVTFSDPEYARRAQDLVLPTVLGKQVEVLLSLSRGDPELDTQQRGPDSRCKLFIGGLPQSVSETELKNFFQQFGTVITTEIKRDFSNERSRGFGFVVYADPRSAEAALACKSLVLQGKQVDIQATIKRGDASLAAKTCHDPRAKIFVGGLSQDMTEDIVKAHFSMFGEVVSVEVKKDFKTGRSRGFGFVVFAVPKVADLVLSLPSVVIDGKHVEVKAPLSSRLPGGRGGDRSATEQNRKIFCGGLPPEAEEQDLNECFNRIGQVVSSEIKRDPVTKKSRGFGFVVFSHFSSCEAAVQLPPGSFRIRGKTVDIKLAHIAKKDDEPQPPSLPTSAPSSSASHVHNAPALFPGIWPSPIPAF